MFDNAVFYFGGLVMSRYRDKKHPMTLEQAMGLPSKPIPIDVSAFAARGATTVTDHRTE